MRNYVEPEPTAVKMGRNLNGDPCYTRNPTMGTCIAINSGKPPDRSIAIVALASLRMNAFASID